MGDKEVALLVRKLHEAGQVYDRRIGELLVATFTSALADLTVRQIELGFSEAFKTCKFFPTPSEILESLKIALEREPSQVPAPVNSVINPSMELTVIREWDEPFSATSDIHFIEYQNNYRRVQFRSRQVGSANDEDRSPSSDQRGAR